MQIKNPWIGIAAALVLLTAVRSQAIRYEIVPEDETILVDDSDAVLILEYAQRARESIDAEKGRTAAAQLRRVAQRAERASDLASGEARDALLAIKSEALRLAYAAETRSDSAARRIGEFTKRTENFVSGEWVLLEAKHALARGDLKSAQTCLTLAVQQMSRRAKRTGKDEGKPFEEAGKDVEAFLDELGWLSAADATSRVAGLVKTARDLKPAPPKKKEEKKKAVYPSYEPYDRFRTTPVYEPPVEEYDAYGSRREDRPTYDYENEDSESTASTKATTDSLTEDPN